jgi:hypothetical protein
MVNDAPLTITLSREELRIVRAALASMLEDFGHDEAEQLRALKALLSKLPADQPSA